MTPRLWWRWILFAGLALYISAMTVVGGWTYWQLERDGTEATGVVTGLSVRHGYRASSTRHEVKYRFRDAEGSWHTGSQTINRQFYRPLHEGQRLSVLYSSSHPEANAASLENLHDTVAGFAFASLIVGVVGAAGAWLLREKRTPEWQLP